MRRHGPTRKRGPKGLAETPAAGPRPPARGERLDLRVPQDVKALIRQAADLEGRSVSDFILGTVLPEARRVVLEQSVIAMSRAGQAQVAALLAEPPAPNRALRALFDRHKDPGRRS